MPRAELANHADQLAQQLSAAVCSEPFETNCASMSSSRIARLL